MNSLGERVKNEVSLLDTIQSYGIQTRPTGPEQHECLCPFHNDRHLGSFKIDNRKGKWTCYSCGEWGDASDFVSKMEGISVFEAAQKLLGLDKQAAPVVKKERVKKVVVEENPKREAEYLAKIYRAFVNSAPSLSEEHVKHLLEERKVSPKDYFEWPECDEAFWKRFSEELSKIGITIDETTFDGVPGFYRDKDSGEVLFSSYKGIGIILHDADGEISALQCRADSGRTRYKIFSSGFAKYNDTKDSFTHGSSIGQVPDIVFPEKTPKTAFITEGHFKGEALARRGGIVLCLNGVTAQEPVDDFLEAIKKYGRTTVVIAFDSDIYEKTSVKKAAKRLCDHIAASGVTPFLMAWKPEFGKGIDDFFNNPDPKKEKYIKCMKADSDIMKRMLLSK